MLALASARWLGADAWRSARLLGAVLLVWASAREYRLRRSLPHAAVPARQFFEKWRNVSIEATTIRGLRARAAQPQALYVAQQRAIEFYWYQEALAYQYHVAQQPR